MKNFEMANVDNPEEIILATQRSFTAALLDIVREVKATTKQPGLTWDQIEYLISGMGNKQPKIIVQTSEM